MVPAFTGLGAPYWDMYARGTICGLTRGSGRSHIVRAALESIGYQSMDLVEAMEADTDLALSSLRVDGGASANDFLMQFQADILGRKVIRPLIHETTALGAACLAGLVCGWWNMDELLRKRTTDQEFDPSMDTSRRQRLIDQWHAALSQILHIGCD